jgi:Spy/CpxP family protein refolding chaperone
MIHKTTLTVLAVVFILAGTQVKYAYSQTGTVAPSAQRSDMMSLTAEQRAQFKSIHQSTREQLQALRNDQTLSPEQREAKARSIREGAHQQILGMLTPQQQELMKNNRRERRERGMGRGFGRGEGRGDGEGAALGLTAEQKSQLKSIHESTRGQVSGIRNDSTLTPEQKEEKIRSLHQGVRQQVSGILTPEQREKMKEEHRARHRGGPGRFGGAHGRPEGSSSGSPAAKP